MTNCHNCGAPQDTADTKFCPACGVSQAQSRAATPLAPSRAAILAEVSRVSKAEAWHAHVPENRLVDRQKRARRAAIGLILLACLLSLPLGALMGMRAADAARNQETIRAAVMAGAAIFSILLAFGSLVIVGKIRRSVRAYDRAPLERCPALVVAKRSTYIAKRGGEQNDFVTLEFSNGERREYLSDKQAFGTLEPERAGLAFLRANHLLAFRLLPGENPRLLPEEYPRSLPA